MLVTRARHQYFLTKLSFNPKEEMLCWIWWEKVKELKQFGWGWGNSSLLMEFSLQRLEYSIFIHIIEQLRCCPQCFSRQATSAKIILMVTFGFCFWNKSKMAAKLWLLQENAHVARYCGRIGHATPYTICTSKWRNSLSGNKYPFSVQEQNAQGITLLFPCFSEQLLIRGN